MATTTNFGWETPDDTDLVKDGAAAIRTALGGVDTSFVDLKGGTTGQVLAKASNTDLDFVWSADAAGMTNPMTTTGDTIYSSSGSTPARLPIGSTGNVLTVAGGVPTWVAPAGGGKVLQVIQDTDLTSFSTTSTTPVDTGLSVTITPSATSSRIMVFATICSAYSNVTGASTYNNPQFNLNRSSTILQKGQYGPYNYASATNSQTVQTLSFSYLDSPATTSATTYKITGFLAFAPAGTSLGYDGSSTNQLSITVMEIGA
jgi:hypothetical protein